MKNYLAIDTSSNYMTVVCVLNGKRTETFLPDCTMQHSPKLMLAVDDTLKRAGATLADFDFFACVVGAGSFTGIRIGISTVKAFCSATGKPSLPITSFALSAYNNTERKEKILSLVDALHGYYFACGFEDGKEILAPSYLSEDEIKKLQADDSYRLCSVEKLPIESEIFSPVDGLFSAVEFLSKEEENFGELKGVYVRKSQAEIAREGE